MVGCARGDPVGAFPFATLPSVAVRLLLKSRSFMYPTLNGPRVANGP